MPIVPRSVRRLAAALLVAAPLAAQQEAPPIAAEQLTSLLGAGVSPERIASLLRERGCSAVLDDALESALSRANAPAALREQVRSSCRPRSSGGGGGAVTATALRIRDWSTATVRRSPEGTPATECGACTEDLPVVLPDRARIEARYALTAETYTRNVSRLDFAENASGRMALTCDSRGQCALQADTPDGPWKTVTPWTAVPALNGGTVRELHVILFVRGMQVDAIVNGDWIFSHTADRALGGKVGVGVNSKTTVEVRSLLAEPLAASEATLAALDPAVTPSGANGGACETTLLGGRRLLEAGSATRCTWRLPFAAGRSTLPSRFQLFWESVPERSDRADDAFALDYASADRNDLSLVYDLNGALSIQRFVSSEGRWSTVISAPAGTLRVARGTPVRLRLVQDGNTVTVTQDGKRVLSGTVFAPASAWPELTVNGGTRVAAGLVRVETLP